MFSNTPFYFKLTRKYVVLFGNMFNNITVVRKNRDTEVELERFKVPIVYANKEKYFVRLNSDPDLTRGVQAILPRMSFEMTGMTYDATRKQASMLRAARANTASQVQAQYMGVPYDLNFELNVYSRNIDDGTQIIEQILPYFNPDYTVTINSVPDIGFLKDIPLVLNSVSNAIEVEGTFDAVRYVYWTLTFTMKAYYFGPISPTKIIRKVIANINNDNTLQAGYIVRVNTGTGNGDFKLEDVVYQGPTYDTANAYGTVLTWSNANNKLVIGGAQGQFVVGQTVRGLSTNAAHTISSFEAGPLKLSVITVEPDPITAEPDDDYGYTTTITEWPNT